MRAPTLPALGHGLAGLPDRTDVLVVGLGVTGAGVALDAASRGLDVVAVDAHDVGFGTSRWSSKLVHGGLRYLARGQLGVAHESAVERGVLMETTAPHLVRPLPMLLPLTPAVPRLAEVMARSGIRAGDLLRHGAGTARETLPRPRRLGVTETLALAPVVRRDGLRGSVLSWDGQLEDDVRLVLAIARTAVREGATVRTRVRVERAGGGEAVLLDTTTGERRTVRARVVVNATGVWAGGLAPGVRLRPSRGSHLVLRAGSLPGVACAVMAPVPGSRNRFVFVLPQPDGTFYLGLTDEPVDAVSDVPEVPEADVEHLLGVVNRVLGRSLRREEVVGAFAGLRPLVAAGTARTADLSRRHAVLHEDGVVTVVGGKLTTYRRMAEDAVDVAVREAGLVARPCRTRELPLVGAAPRGALAGLAVAGVPARLVRRFGTEAGDVLASARTTGLDDATLLAPAAPDLPVTLAELLFGVTHEGARDVADLLERRTRVALVEGDARRAAPLAERALALASVPG